MKNLPEFARISHELQTRRRGCEERIEDYLEHLTAPLIGIVPYAERRAFREEAHAHIDGLICEFEHEGQEALEATESALREFGEPWKLGQAFLQEWSQGAPHLSPTGLIRKAAWTAFGGFGAASMLTLLMLEVYAFNPSQASLTSIIGLLAFFSPLAAGSFVGAKMPAQARRGISIALSILILHSCAVGMLMPSRREGLLFAAWQLLFWLPAGWGSASVTAACLRYVRRQRFWQTAR
ncbi:MAG: hypothetical protein JWL77_4693 [Chthonomonadaceae bacterium]|nr:hypothetical protein [Chthonomonadaceae bacterium]